MNQKIERLLRKRQQHDIIINNLLKNNFITPSSSITKDQQTSQEFLAQTFRSNLSRQSDLSKQVNLLAHLRCTEQDKKQSAIQESSNLLKDSIFSDFGQSINIHFNPEPQNQILISRENSIDFEIIVNFFNTYDLWEEIFYEQQGHYYAKIYGFSFEKQNQPFCLSTSPLMAQQLQLVSKNEQEVYIGYLLLYRILSLHLKTGFAPSVIQYILGNPYRSYQIQATTQYFAFISDLKNLKSKDINQIMVLGRKKINNEMEQIDTRQIGQHLQQIISSYTQIFIIQIDHLNTKQLQVAHQRNHHIVIDFQSDSLNQYLFTLMPKKGSQQNNSSGTLLYRLCILDQNLQIIKNQVIKECEYIRTVLKKSEYKIYVSEISDKKQSNFKFLVQSRNSIQDTEIYLKFIEQYNSFSRTIINKYLQTIELEEIEKQMIRMRELHSKVQVLVIRANLSFLNFHIDFISLNTEKAKRLKKLTIEYEQEQVFCDQDYKSNSKKFNINNLTIFQVYLSKKASIRSINQMSFSQSELNL